MEFRHVASPSRKGSRFEVTDMRYRVVLAVVLSGAAAVVAAAQAPTPPQFQIVSSLIQELRPLDKNLSRRRVLLHVRLAASPVCTTNQEYGFLIDADKDANTGVTDDALEKLGIDARVVMRCDRATGQFTSPTGRVTQNGARLELLTTVDRLPSVDFFWAPYAMKDGVVSLVGDQRRYGRWAIFERSLP
jgi:hypothetical protein